MLWWKWLIEIKSHINQTLQSRTYRCLPEEIGFRSKQQSRMELIFFKPVIRTSIISIKQFSMGQNWNRGDSLPSIPVSYPCLFEKFRSWFDLYIHYVCGKFFCLMQFWMILLHFFGEKISWIISSTFWFSWEAFLEPDCTPMGQACLKNLHLSVSCLPLINLIELSNCLLSIWLPTVQQSIILGSNSSIQ